MTAVKSTTIVHFSNLSTAIEQDDDACGFFVVYLQVNIGKDQ